jgi:Holliday junction DNA helicase RuvA
MIGFLEGKIHTVNEKFCIVLINGVGYTVFSPLSTLTSLKKGEEVSFFIHTHVREVEFSLYGFKKEEELFIFEKLISVSGIGPKSALSMLSNSSPKSLAKAIENSDTDILSHTPGVGKKTAEKIIIELKGKLIHLLSGEEDNAYDSRLALESLGYSSKEINEVINKINTKGKNTNTIIKEALKQLH